MIAIGRRKRKQGFARPSVTVCELSRSDRRSDDGDRGICRSVGNPGLVGSWLGNTVGS